MLSCQKQREKKIQQALLENRFIASFSTVESKAANEDHLIQLFFKLFYSIYFPHIIHFGRKHSELQSLFIK